MNKMDFFKKHKFIAILRRLNPKYSTQVIKALYDGGIRIFEVTFNPSDDNTCNTTKKIIREIKDLYGNEVMVGAGTVICMEYAKAAGEVDAEFLVSPCTDKSIIGPVIADIISSFVCAHKKPHNAKNSTSNG